MFESIGSEIRVLIVDDHPVIRYGLKYMLESEDDIKVVGELDDILGIGELIPDLRPDVVLLDLELGDTCGVDALRRVRQEAPELHVIIYTSHDEEDRIIQAAELGVSGYLLKGSPKEQIISAIRSVNEGGTALESSVATKLMHHMNKRGAKDKEQAVHFSKRETQVLKLAASGKTNRDIGKALFISESTVKFHMHAILNKLDAGNRTEAVSIAVQLGMITLTPEEQA
jgi:DNA-binding NarL/FixJ family response regulator